MTRSCLGVLLALLALPCPAFAFSDSSSFNMPPAAAGGGGRFFTGSPADGYTCKVCHAGGAPADLRVTGLPEAGYALGGRYEIVVSWPSTVDKFSAALELTDLDGKPAGSVELPPMNELLAAEFCEPASDLVPAASLNDAPNSRQVITVPDCGAKQLRFLWNAPTASAGVVWFAGSSVVSDGHGDTNGDGVSDFGRVIAFNAGAGADAASATGGCAVVAPGRTGSERAIYLAAVLWLGSRWRRRTARRRR